MQDESYSNFMLAKENFMLEKEKFYQKTRQTGKYQPDIELCGLYKNNKEIDIDVPPMDEERDSIQMLNRQKKVYKSAEPTKIKLAAQSDAPQAPRFYTTEDHCTDHNYKLDYDTKETYEEENQLHYSFSPKISPLSEQSLVDNDFYENHKTGWVIVKFN